MQFIYQGSGGGGGGDGDGDADTVVDGIVAFYSFNFTCNHFNVL